jgi:hypothetical protein
MGVLQGVYAPKPSLNCRSRDAQSDALHSGIAASEHSLPITTRHDAVAQTKRPLFKNEKTLARRFRFGPGQFVLRAGVFTGRARE